MCACGAIGCAQITPGRLSATASATARDPSICLSMALSLLCASPVTVVVLIPRLVARPRQGRRTRACVPNAHWAAHAAAAT